MSKPLLPLLAEACTPVARAVMPDDEAAELARMFKAVGDPVRLKLLSMIASDPRGEACVCDLTEAFTLTGPTISHHLKVLRDAGLIASERRASWVYYRAVPEATARLSAVLAPLPAATA
ncbi:ArsR/SmtB family transcription factor [Phytomonospora endophytica]|uniref:ArsR family transcriptional regulator n=1 Tax=Phytomonospora endophytica TaxID=714109 RepID=A0A841FJ79_9ACTN|nr:metalloregulator ArsR/SmtB family transcription factor [Phytomonospora endophytica]MBB6033612.1 ArsR family transcriptional regulator [Phytomonospora endophytica]GIG64873.1 transcriptional regulator [Phytomonospora endophytica]